MTEKRGVENIEFQEGTTNYEEMTEIVVLIKAAACADEENKHVKKKRRTKNNKVGHHDNTEDDIAQMKSRKLAPGHSTPKYSKEIAYYEGFEAMVNQD